MRLAGTTFRQWFLETLWPGLLPGLAAAAVMMMLKSVVHPVSWLSLGLCAAAGMGSFLAALFLLCLRPADKEDLRQLGDEIRMLLAPQ